jgi:hypothetical protein
MNMDDAMKCCMGALTVTGTVGYEAVMGKGRCISVLHPVLAKNFSDFTAPTIEEAVEALLQSPTAGRGSSQQGADLLQKLYARSYPGYINDPVSDPLCLDAANISKISNALLKTITSKAAL